MNGGNCATRRGATCRVAGIEKYPCAPRCREYAICTVSRADGGPLIYSISEDPVAAAKVVNDFAKSNDKFVIRTGMNEGKVMDLPSIQALANIPGREELLARLLG